MYPLSKKQLDHLRNAFGLFAAALLICFPAARSVDAEVVWLPVFTSAALALGTAHLLLQLGKIPSGLRICLFFPLACSVAFTLLALPHPLMVVWLLIPFALLLLSQRQRFKQIPAPLYYLVVYLVLVHGSLSFFDLLLTLPHQGLPRLPTHRYIWLGILLVVPLGFATRKRLLPFAKAVLKIEFLVFSVLLGLYPLLWTSATAFKLPGEPALHFHELNPLPRFFLLPKLGTDKIYPSELRKTPEKTLLLKTLDEMTWRLSDLYIAGTFSGEEQLSPAQQLRSMKLYGFLLEDRHGPFLPGTSFGRPAPPEMNERYLQNFNQSMDQIVLSPSELSSILEVSSTEAGELLKTLEDLNWARRVPGAKERYRLTSQARRPYENQLYPRQLLLLENVKEDQPVEIILRTYGERRALPLREKRRELENLVAAGAAEKKTVWKLNQHHHFLLNPALWNKTVLLTLALLLALLAGRCLPDTLPKPKIWILSLLGLALFWPLPFSPGFQSAFRIGIGIWILRNLTVLTAEDNCRLLLFAPVIFISGSLTSALPEGTALVHQAVWVILWTLPALTLLIFSLRKMHPGTPDIQH